MTIEQEKFKNLAESFSCDCNHCNLKKDVATQTEPESTGQMQDASTQTDAVVQTNDEF